MFLTGNGDDVTDAGSAHFIGNTSRKCLRLGPGIMQAWLISGLVQLGELRPGNCERRYCGNAGMEYIAELVNLETVSLQYTRIGDAGLSHLARITKLWTLELECTLVTDDGLNHLMGLLL